ncbi:hypothetical protein [Actinomadura sp. 9N407]|uniref:hypothetical protein n=1 Tax=Actinomadura sp. 9N407 TaxID=3375154 RepID=UPI0037B087E6
MGTSRTLMKACRRLLPGHHRASRYLYELAAEIGRQGWQVTVLNEQSPPALRAYAHGQEARAVTVTAHRRPCFDGSWSYHFEPVDGRAARGFLHLCGVPREAAEQLDERLRRRLLS